MFKKCLVMVAIMGIIITPSVAQISSTSCYCPDNCDSFVIRPKTDIDNDSFVIRPKTDIDNDSFVIRPKTDICGRFVRPSDQSNNSRRVRVVTARERHELSTKEMMRLWEKAGTLSSAPHKWYKRPLKWIGAVKSVPRYHHIKKWEVSAEVLHLFAISKERKQEKCCRSTQKHISGRFKKSGRGSGRKSSQISCKQ